jgi:exodeoxyribonuclease VII large subunit
VSELTAYIREVLDRDPALGDVWVEGEATNVTRSTAGHVYFSLRDPSAQIKCVLFRSYARVQACLPENGYAVLVHGYVSVYEQAGAYQLYVDELRLRGDGALQRAFRQLYERLASEGLFAESRKRPLPTRPRWIGVVTSPTGAVWHDIQTVLRRRYPLAHLLLAPAQVQGTEAPASVVAALEVLNQDGRADVIVIARGGGSLEDLWCFNDEQLVRAVFRSRIPVVSAIGHETDVTLCDFVADLRAPTPSAAAEMIAPDLQTLLGELSAYSSRLVTSVSRRLQTARERIERALSRLEHSSPRRRIDHGRLHLDQLGRRLLRQLAHGLQTQRTHLALLSRQLQLLHPSGPLQRGYVLVTDRSSGRRQRSVRGLVPGQWVTLHFIDGVAEAQVTEAGPTREGS